MPLPEKVAVVCLQAQRVTGLPAAVEQIELRCHLGHLGLGEAVRVRASTSSSLGVATFQNQVLLLHCGAVGSIAVSVSVSLSPYHMHGTARHQQHGVGVFPIDLGGRQLEMEPLSFVLSGAAAGAVLTLALHHRLLSTRTNKYHFSSCLPLPLPGCCCLRMNNNRRRHHQQLLQLDDHSDESSGYITIEKHGTISRRPQSDDLLDDDSICLPMKLDLDEHSRVEDEFLAMLDSHHSDSDLDLDMLIKEAEAELAKQPA